MGGSSSSLREFDLPSDSQLSDALRRHWGYDSFRPMQERIVRCIAAGQDVAVVMPTGGGKSLCYQLPAAVSEGTAIVISPLLALMQDQVAQLTRMGIAAAAINSATPPGEQSKILKTAIAGGYRLLYLAPERLVRADTLGWLTRVPVSFFAIDEAHCISEWGHEFRPEYRQLSSLKEMFPDRPIAAFTASATRQVRHDILQQLRMRQPAKFIASFHRPNLRYLVTKCDAATQVRLLTAALKEYTGENVIVYVPTIQAVDDTVELLRKKGVKSVPYHGQMQSGERRKNQELWMDDEIPVIVGTLAFGLGINKPSVRAVIHLSLPKSVEQYYQEAGRAGRDGKPADCALLWQGRDAGLLAFFANQVQDPRERQNAWNRYNAIRAFVEEPACRHRSVCLHFGETPKWDRCGMCDVCGPVPEWTAGRTTATSATAPRRNATSAPSKAPVSTVSDVNPRSCCT
ncbi:MAG: ATP-dependent DNA helicase RecQ [Bryobacteraceae bacterium]